MTITTCIISNGKDLPALKKCVKSVLSLSDEILINCNHNSFKKISALFNHKKIKCFPYKWIENFSDARNFLIQKAQSEFIFIVDNDEYINFKKFPFDIDKNLIYTFRINDLQSDGTIRTYDSIRLFSKDKSYSGMVHETIEMSLKGEKVCNTRIDIIHTGYLNEKVLRKKLERNEKILQNDTDNEFKDFHLFRHYVLNRNYEKIIETGKKILNNDIFNPGIKSLVCNEIFITYRTIGGEALGIPFLQHSLKIVPAQLTARYLVIEYLEKLKGTKELILNEIEKIKNIIHYKTSDYPADVIVTEKMIQTKIDNINKNETIN